MTEAQLKTISAQSLKSLLDDDAVVLVDVREPTEYANEHIKGSILKPLSTFDPTALKAFNGKSVILHCQGGVRSAQAAQKLFAAGETEVTHLEGGLMAWKAAGLPTQTGR